MEIVNKLVLRRAACLGLAMLPGFTLWAHSAEATSGERAPTSPPASTKPLLATELPSQAPRPIAGPGDAPPGSGSVPDRAEAAKLTEPPPRPHTIRDLTENFNVSREQALKKREAERKLFTEKLRTATGEERTRLISEYREKQRSWLEEQKSIAEEFRLRMQSMREEFKNRERDQILDEVKGKVQEVRERLGKD